MPGFQTQEEHGVVSLAQAGQFLGNRFLPALQYPDYRKLWFATLCSQSAAWSLIVARGALVRTITDSDVWTGIVTFAAMIPSMLIAPFAGYLADRFDRRKVLLVAYVVNLGQNVLLALLVAGGIIDNWRPEIILTLLALLNGCARSTQMPASQALLANTVPRERLFNAVALNQATQQGSRFVGPLLVLAMLWISGPWVSENKDWIFFLPVGLYVIGLVLILNIRTVSRGVVEAGTGIGVIFRNVSAGLHYMYNHPVVLSLILLVVAHCAMTMSFESLFPALSTEKLGLEKGAGILRGYSYLMVGYGTGALVTAVTLAGVQGEATRGRLFLWMGVISGVASMALGLSPNLAVAMVAVTVMGVFQGGFMTLSGGMIQSIAPDAIRGRLMSVHSWHIQGFMASFNLFNGLLAGFSGLTAAWVLGGGGVAFIMVMVLSFARLPLREIYGRGLTEEARAQAVPSAG